MSNFSFLKSDKGFSSFAGVAEAAEKTYNISPSMCAMGCRQAMEFAVKWMYAVDGDLSTPFDDKLISLLSGEDFKDIVGTQLAGRLDFIRKVGNIASHDATGVSKKQAMLCLEHLHAFMNFIAYCYGSDEDFTEVPFDASLVENTEPAPMPQTTVMDVGAVMAQAEQLSAAMTANRSERSQNYTVPPVDFTEAETRRAYIDVMVSDAGWLRGKNWIDEYKIEDMPNQSGYGFADYALLGDDGVPLAIIEAKRTSVDVSKGRQQAVLYANDIEHRFGRRPVIFLSNGYDTRIWIDCENGYPEHKVSGIYSKRDLEKLFNIFTMRAPLGNVAVDEKIAGRYYQKEAIRAVCDTFDTKNKRKALLVMATGSGKTRTTIALVKALIDNGWVKNFLFLADRNALVRQAKRAFANFMPDLSITNLVEDKSNTSARGVFSTYQTMIGCIDGSRDEANNRVFTCGHFDLIVVDEAHRSIYRKYQSIFTYFDALLVGLTATPKDEIDKNTYSVFGLDDGEPTYGYDIDQAVDDTFLVYFTPVEVSTRFLHRGICYDELSDEDKEEYEKTFADEDGELPESISSSALNDWVFNRDTIRKVLNTLMTYGHRVEYGSKIGKTIIFAKNHNHAEEIVKVWNEEYSNYPQHYCMVIDNTINYAQQLIDDFSEPDKLPQIAVSVDMLDTGIDVEEILNLVFFKDVYSRAKFWQMIGRGTRPCPGLIDGKDKDGFYIFDFCGNFEFFSLNAKGRETPIVLSVQERLFNLRARLAMNLQPMCGSQGFADVFRETLVNELTERVKKLNRDNFAVKQHLEQLDKYSKKEAYTVLDEVKLMEISEHLAPLAEPEEGDFNAVRFDALLYGIELALLENKNCVRAKRNLMKSAATLTNYFTIPEVAAKKDLITSMLNTDFIEKAGIEDFERVRTELRDLIKYIEVEQRPLVFTNMDDEIESIEFGRSEVTDITLTTYKEKVNYYLRMYEHEPAIAKLHTNQPLLPSDIERLEEILWHEAGTKQDYTKEYGEMPLGELVRSVVGLDSQTAKDIFARFIDEQKLDSKQVYFVNQIINYVVRNGMIKDMKVLQASPFSDRGSISDLFVDMSVWNGIRMAIDAINNGTHIA